MVLPIHIHTTSWSSKLGKVVHFRHGALYNATKGNGEPHCKLLSGQTHYKCPNEKFFTQKLTTRNTTADNTTTTGAQFTSLRFIVVVQQKSSGSRNSLGGPRGGRLGGNCVAFRYGLGIGHSSSDQRSTWTDIVLSGR